MKNEPQVYMIRPDRTPLYLPLSLAQQLRREVGDTLTVAEYESAPVQALIAERLANEKGKAER